MKVFISWSGEKSKIAAQAIHSWLPYVIQTIEPWMSSEDIDAGSRWSRDIEEELETSKFGIICLTQSNASSPWINFEAGALAKAVDNSFVCPYLLDLEPTQVPSGPLTLFQAKTTTREHTWDLIKSINSSMPSGSLEESQLKTTFDMWWPNLEKDISNLPSEGTESVTEVSQEQHIEEILSTVRSISRRLQQNEIDKDLVQKTINPQFLDTKLTNFPIFFNKRERQIEHLRDEDLEDFRRAFNVALKAHMSEEKVIDKEDLNEDTNT